MRNGNKVNLRILKINGKVLIYTEN